MNTMKCVKKQKYPLAPSILLRRVHLSHKTNIPGIAIITATPGIEYFIDCQQIILSQFSFQNSHRFRLSPSLYTFRRQG